MLAVEKLQRESGLSFGLCTQVLGFVWMGLNSVLVITNTFHSTVYESLGIQLWITECELSFEKINLKPLCFVCMAVISLVYSRVVDVCVFSNLSPFCSLRPALGGMQIDMRFSF